MRFVITGALGHIGSFLIRELPRAFPDSEILMVDNLKTNRYCSLFNLPREGRYRFLEADVLSADLPAVFAGADVVIHLAAVTDAAASFSNPEEVERVNYRGTVMVAKASLAAGCSLIHMSSTSVYGTQAQVVDEDCSPEELQPQSPYAEAKLKEEAVLRELGNSGSLRFITLRNGTICGISPGMRFHTAVNKFCWQAVTGRPITVWRTALHQKRPYLCLSDAAEAIVYVIRHNLFDGKIYNVLTDNLTVQQIIHYIERDIPHTRIEYVDSPIMNQLSYEVSSARFCALGFAFSGKPEESIRDTISMLAAAGGYGSIEHVREQR
ncbi:MAG: SDR family oxidoreductase [Syntrophaceae bacterium]|nr:SDR family oxidoreductase [Syntrophaceae bacterium]